MLTTRETQVLELAAAGRYNKQIARALGISIWTVKSHLEHAREKLKARSRTQAVVEAMRRGLLRERLGDLEEARDALYRVVWRKQGVAL